MFLTPSKIYMLKPSNFQCDEGSFAGDLIIRVESSQMELVLLERRPLTALPPPPQCPDTVRRQVFHKPGGKTSSSNEFSGALILDFPVSRTLRNKFLLCIPVYGIFVNSS